MMSWRFSSFHDGFNATYICGRLPDSIAIRPGRSSTTAEAILGNYSKTGEVR